MRNLFLLLLGACLFFSCEDEETDGSEGVIVSVQVLTNAEGIEVPMEGVEVKWTGENTGTVYAAKSDGSGKAVCIVEPGIYRVVGSYRKISEKNNRDTIFSGSLQQVSVSVVAENVFTLRLESAVLSRLVIKELYYGGCRTDEGDAYKLDNYITLYNNSADTVWLDGICIGKVGPLSLMKPSNWLKDNPEMPEIPIFQACWQFPGNGRENPLAPGAETIVAVNAVDHTKGKYGHTQSVNLSGVEWAFYQSHFNPEFSDITPGVKMLLLSWMNWSSKITPPSYGLGPSAPGIVIYRMEGDAVDYAETHLRYEPGQKEISTYLATMVPREWVLDYVECVEKIEYVNNKRVPAVLDKSALYLSEGAWSGKAFHRKVASKTDGRVIYQDTNDSANDFEEGIPQLRK